MKARFGEWRSPITPELCVETGLQVQDICADGANAYWTEVKPAEQGRNSIVMYDGKSCREILSPPWSAKTAVHEYGSGALAACDGVVYFSNSPDHGLYRIDSGAEPELVCAIPDVRFADFVVDPSGNRLITVVEDHRGDAVKNYLATIGLASGELTPIVSGADFYSSPRIDANGGRLAWIEWDFPSMPWDSTRLNVAALPKSGPIKDAELVAGNGESLLHPDWSPDNVLHFISDATGWWNLYQWNKDGIFNRYPVDADCAQAPWVFGLQSYSFLSDGSVVLIVNRDAQQHLCMLSGNAHREISSDFIDMRRRVVTRDGTLLTAAAKQDHPAAVVEIDTAKDTVHIVRSAPFNWNTDYISHGRPITFPSGDAVAHAVFYPPKNPEFEGDGTPPLIVYVHGGPNSVTANSFDSTAQFFTSRGFAYCNVNYRGSTTYGRKYREALYGGVGEVDVADALNVVTYLASQGLVDGNAAFIHGGSAGGHIALLAVCGSRVFAGCSSHFGVSDAKALAADTHKFESRYYDKLIGPLPEFREVYEQRSPINRIGEISVPVLLFQGLDDKIVPPDQSRRMFDELAGHGVPVAMLEFAGEGHGFRRKETRTAVFDTELWFFCRIMGGGIAKPQLPLRTANL